MARPFLRRLGLIFAAWALGWLGYLIVALMTGVFDGALSFIFQPIIAVFVSAIFVGLTLLIARILFISFVGRLWHSSRWLALGLAAASMFLMLFGGSLGLNQIYTDPETGSKYVGVGLDSGVAWGCYFLLVFSIANFPPLKKKSVPVV